MPEPIDCRSPEGKTEGLADSIIGIVWVLSEMDLSPENVKGALQDLFESPELEKLRVAAYAD